MYEVTIPLRPVKDNEVGVAEDYFKIIREEYASRYLEMLNIASTPANKADFMRYRMMDDCDMMGIWPDMRTSALADAIRIVPPLRQRLGDLADVDEADRNKWRQWYGQADPILVRPPDIGVSTGTVKLDADEDANAAAEASSGAAAGGAGQEVENKEGAAAASGARVELAAELEQFRIGGAEKHSELLGGKGIRAANSRNDAERMGRMKEELDELKAKFILPFACERPAKQGSLDGPSRRSELVVWPMQGPLDIDAPQEMWDEVLQPIRISLEDVKKNNMKWVDEQLPLEFLSSRTAGDLWEEVPMFNAAAQTTQTPLLGTPKAQQTLPKAPQCPNGHPMKKFTLQQDEFLCGQCGNKCRCGAVFFGCKQCSFDKCRYCVRVLDKVRLVMKDDEVARLIGLLGHLLHWLALMPIRKEGPHLSESALQSLFVAIHETWSQFEKLYRDTKIGVSFVLPCLMLTVKRGIERCFEISYPTLMSNELLQQQTIDRINILFMRLFDPDSTYARCAKFDGEGKAIMLSKKLDVMMDKRGGTNVKRLHGKMHRSTPLVRAVLGLASTSEGRGTVADVKTRVMMQHADGAVGLTAASLVEPPKDQERQSALLKAAMTRLSDRMQPASARAPHSPRRGGQTKLHTPRSARGAGVDCTSMGASAGSSASGNNQGVPKGNAHKVDEQTRLPNLPRPVKKLPV
jgi:hypothetical protein